MTFFSLIVKSDYLSDNSIEVNLYYHKDSNFQLIRSTPSISYFISGQHTAVYFCCFEFTHNWQEEMPMIVVADRIKNIREQHHLTQSELARRLGITRAGVNAWEQGISIPSTQYLTALAELFHVSTDYLLGIDSTATIDISGLTDEDKQLVLSMVKHLRQKNS